MAIKTLLLLWSLFAAFLGSTALAQAQRNADEPALTTLEQVRERGTLICGASNNRSGFAEQDENKRWYGFDVDFCRALAAAIFNDSSRVEFRALQGNARYVELQAGEIDVLARSAPWTLDRDVSKDVHFVGTSFFDGQSFLVANNNDSVSILDLEGQTICVENGSNAQDLMHRFFFDNQIEFVEQAYEDLMDLPAAYQFGLCNVVTADHTQLQNFRLSTSDPAAHKILPERISMVQFGPVVRAHDDGWNDIVRWTLFNLINAEELGVKSTNVGTMLESRTPAIRRLLGVEGDLATNLGLETTWVRNMIEQVGNYGELFARNLGPDTPVNMQRGLNALWTDGGLLYAPPVR